MQSNEELIREAMGGTRAAFAELLRRYERAAWTTAWNVLRNHHATQDATQDAFLEAYRQLAQLRSPEHFGVWLLKITRRAALRIARRRPVQMLNAVADIPAGDTPDAIAADSSELLAAIGSLPEHERLVISLRYLDGHAVAEVARLTGRPVGTVTKQLSRAIERLQIMLKEVQS